MDRTQRAIVFSLIMLALGAVCAVVSFQYPADSSGFPRAIAILLIILSAAELLRNYRLRSQRMDAHAAIESNLPAASQEQNAELRAALLVFASAPLFILLARLFDFEIATFIYLLGGMFILGIRKPIVIVGISVAVLIIIKMLFFTLLDVSRTPTIVFGS